MYTYILLVVFIISIIFLNKRIYKFDCLSPSFLYNGSMLISIICSMFGLISWNSVNTLSYETILIIVLSILFFNIGELVIRKILSFKGNEKKKRFDIVLINNRINIVFLGFVLISFFLVISEVIRIAKLAGYSGGGIIEIIKTYHKTSILYSTDYIKQGIHINVFVAQLQKIVEVICYFNIYYLIQSIIKKSKKKTWSKWIILNILIIAISVLMSLLIGSRMQMFIYILFALFVILILLNTKYTYIELLKKHWKKAVLVFTMVLVLFYIVLPLTGRKTSSNILDYSTFYFGAPIPSLDRYVNSDSSNASFFGEETFRGIQNIAYKLGISNYIQPITTKWTTFYGKNNVKYQSNIYTSGKRYYHDFGHIGICLIQFVNGIVFSSIYILMVNKKKVLFLIFYGMIIYMIVDQVRDEYLFSTFVHINTIFKFIILWLLVYCSKRKWSLKNEVTNR